MGWLETAGNIIGGAAGAIFGPIGVGAGSVLGGAAGGVVGDVIDWVVGDDDSDTYASGGGGAGSSFGGLPNPNGFNLPGGFNTTGTGLQQSPTANLPAIPGGGMTGPIYGTQALPAAAQNALSVALSALRAYPMISDFLQRYWNFPAEREESAPKSQMLWSAMAKQLPKSRREALEQFLVGFPSPIGLSKSASDVFLALMIAEAGYLPQQIDCCEK